MIDGSTSGNNPGMREFSLALEEPTSNGALRVVEAPNVRARALVNEHFDFVWRLLRRLGVPDADVDDVAQQVFIVGTRRLSDIPVGSERTFLYGTALRMAATTRRNLRRREHFFQSVPTGNDGSRTPHEELERRQALSFLDRVLQGLDDDQREVFVLCEIEELTAPEVAAIARIPIGTVASRLRRARVAFASELKRLKAQET